MLCGGYSFASSIYPRIRCAFRYFGFCTKGVVPKSSYKVYRRKRLPKDQEIFIDDRKVDQVSRCVYLGVSLIENMSPSEDVERAMNTFYDS